MPRSAVVPPSLRFAPFRGSAAIERGLLTRGQLAGPAWRRLFRDIYVSADAIVDHLTLCHAAMLLVPPGAALSHESAAFLYNVYNVNLVGLGPPKIHVTVPAGCGIGSGRGLVVHRLRNPERAVSQVRAALKITTNVSPRR